MKKLMIIPQSLSMMVLGLMFWIFVSCVIFVSSARADFRVCNSTQGFIGVAVGYPVTTGWASEGWWLIGAASCKTVIEGPLISRFYYLYAEDASGKGRWDGPIAMCGKTKQFKIEGVEDCYVQGGQKFGFQEVDTGNQRSWMVDLREPEIDGDAFSDPFTTFNAN